MVNVKESAKVMVSVKTQIPSSVGIAKPSVSTVTDGGTQITITSDTDPYTGSYVVTPSENQQVLNTANLRMASNVTINPIPSNYGRVIYDGGLRIV